MMKFARNYNIAAASAALDSRDEMACTEMETAKKRLHVPDRKVLFPFQNTKVHSDGWRASDHAVFHKKDS